jgi:DNA-binding beta-propeller fold protein YncE
MQHHHGAISPGSGFSKLAAAWVFLAAMVFSISVGASSFHGNSARHADRIDHGGVVYVMTNDANGNEIRVYLRDHKGRLTALPRATAATGGLGASTNAAIDPLGSQAALVYDAGTDMLFAVNAGDNTVTAFETGPIGVPLRRSARVASGGFIPVSVAVSENHLYVLNAGGTGSIATFEIGEHGELAQIGSFDLGLSAAATAPPFNQVLAPGQVGVDALARQLIIAHGGGQELLTAALDDAGVPVGPLVSTPSPGIVPFAFGVTPYGSTLVAEAGSGAVSAYDPPAGGNPLLVTAASVATGQAATCWIAVGDAGYAYVSNTGSGTLSLYGYSRTGNLALLEALAGTPGGAPIDLTFANEGGFLYVLDAAGGQVFGFAVDEQSGALAQVEAQGGLPAAAGLQGIAARDYR